MCGPIGDGPETSKESLKFDIRDAKVGLKQAKADAKADAKYYANVIREKAKGIAALQKQLAKLK